MAQPLTSSVPAGLNDLLDRRSGLHACPSPAGVLRFEGEVRFRAAPADGPTIEDTYHIRIDIPRSFPDNVPEVTEIGGRIPRNDPDAHVNPNDSLCLGSPLRLLLIAKSDPSVAAFFDRCVVSALYNASHRERYGGRLPLGELAHGMIGELDDYKDLFGLQTYAQVFKALELAGTKRRAANKMSCPCGCGRRLGVCRTNSAVLQVRRSLGRIECARFSEQLRARVTEEVDLIEKMKRIRRRK